MDCFIHSSLEFITHANPLMYEAILGVTRKQNNILSYVNLTCYANNCSTGNDKINFILGLMGVIHQLC